MDPLFGGADLFFCFLHQFYQFFGTLSKKDPFFCQRDFFIAADEKLFSQFIFQFLQLPGQRRLSH